MVNPLKGFENTLKILHLSVRTLRTVWTVWTQRVTWDRIFRWTSGKLTFIFKKKFYWWSYTINENLQNYMHTYYYPFVLNRIFCIRTKSNIYKEYNLIFFYVSTYDSTLTLIVKLTVKLSEGCETSDTLISTRWLSCTSKSSSFVAIMSNGCCSLNVLSKLLNDVTATFVNST